MKAVMIGLALFLVMGCGRSDAKKLSEELDARNKAWEAEVEALSNARPNEPTKAKTTVGGKLWEFETVGMVWSSPAIGSDGTVYVGSIDNKLYAINGKSGVKLWEFETGGDVWSPPAIGSDGTVYVGSDDNKLYAIKTDSKGPAKSPWPMFGQNAQHTGRTSTRE